MKTNELKKGQRIKLRNGWEAEIADNMRGNTRMAKVFGHFTETGSVYSHDIVSYLEKGDDLVPPRWSDVEHTKPQLKLMQQVEQFYGGN